MFLKLSVLLAGGDLKITDKLGLNTNGFGTLTSLYMNSGLIYYYRNVSNEKSDVSSKDDNKSKFDELKKRILEEKETFFYLVVDEGEEKKSLRASFKYLNVSNIYFSSLCSHS